MNCNPVRVSQEQIKSFREHGYVCLRTFFPPGISRDLRTVSDEMSSQAVAILESCRATGVSVADRAKAKPAELIVAPEQSSPIQICRYEFMIGSSSQFLDFVTHHVEPAVTELVGEAVTLFKDKTNEKLPGGGAFGPHQDFAAYRSFKPRYHVTALLTVDPANRVNGCLQMATNFDELIAAKCNCVLDTIDGKALLHYCDGGPCNGDIRADIIAELKWQPLETSPADVVVFDSFVPHYSDANKSNKPRRAVFITFNRLSEGSFYNEYYADKRGNYDDLKFHVSTPTHRGTAAALTIGRARE